MGTISTRSLAVYFLIFSVPIGYFLLPIAGAIYNLLFCEINCIEDLWIHVSPRLHLAKTFSYHAAFFLDYLQSLCVLFFLFGLWVIHRGMKEGEKGYALTRLGLLLLVVATVGSIGWQPYEDVWSAFFASQKVGFIFNTGLILFSLGLSTREQHNKKLAYVVVLATVFFGFGQVFLPNIEYDPSSYAPYAYRANEFHHFLYLVVMVWSITLGLKLRKATR